MQQHSVILFVMSQGLDKMYTLIVTVMEHLFIQIRGIHYTVLVPITYSSKIVSSLHILSSLNSNRSRC